ncbi:MAG: XRE family transcriptional regulator [Actinobacteria bacterium]|nr:XRE family transcriptional regulator [Actinomycetota bacterium]
MISQRLRQLRLARGLSLEDLAARMGGIITKQALSKYENGKSEPSMPVLTKLAAALGVKSAYLWGEPRLSVQVAAYRKNADLAKKEEERVENVLRLALEDRVRLQELTLQTPAEELPIKAWAVAKVEDAESAARELRKRWDLGIDPISSVTSVLEAHLVHVVEIDSLDGFDGLSASAYDEEGRIVAVAVASRTGLAGDRQRFNLAHELGHLVLRTTAGLEDEERAAHRFASAFLAPAETVRALVGAKRAVVKTEELRLLKLYFGMSMQALLHRLKDLGIITEAYYTRWFKEINRRGWRKVEPNLLPAEEPQWLRLAVLRTLAEGQITRDEASRLLGEPVQFEGPISLVERRALMKLPLEERRRVIAEQAQQAAQGYQEDEELREIEVDDLIEE